MSSSTHEQNLASLLLLELLQILQAHKTEERPSTCLGSLEKTDKRKQRDLSNFCELQGAPPLYVPVACCRIALTGHRYKFSSRLLALFSQCSNSDYALTIKVRKRTIEFCNHVLHLLTFHLFVPYTRITDQTPRPSAQERRPRAKTLSFPGK